MRNWLELLWPSFKQHLTVNALVDTAVFFFWRHGTGRKYLMRKKMNFLKLEIKKLCEKNCKKFHSLIHFTFIHVIIWFVIISRFSLSLWRRPWLSSTEVIFLARRKSTEFKNRKNNHSIRTIVSRQNAKKKLNFSEVYFFFIFLRLFWSLFILTMDYY